VLATLQQLMRDERGAELVEYGLLASLIALVALAAVASFGRSVTMLFHEPHSSVGG
jgi:Flp pilus assembly pilin Flp